MGHPSFIIICSEHERLVQTIVIGEQKYFANKPSNAMLERRYKLLYFIIFSGLGALMPYIPVYFETLSMSKSEIGILTMLPNLCAFLLAPLFGIIGDIFDAHCEVMVFSAAASVVCTVLMLNVDSFYAMFWVVLASSAFRAPVTPQVDAMVINNLEDKSRYGEMRLWGAVGYGILSFIGGAWSQDHTVESFKFNFYYHAVMFVSASMLVLWIVYDLLGSPQHAKHASSPDTKSAVESERTIWQGLLQVFARHPAVLVFSTIVFLSGVGSGVIESFLFLRLKQLGGSGLVMGISRFITCAAEVPLFQLAGKWQQKYGTWVMLAVTQLAFVARFTYYSFLTEPWAVLPCEVLHGLTFAVMWSVSCTYANMISPPECHSTMQALLEGLHWGFGSGVGALMGGFVYDRFGAVWLFELSGLLSFVSLLLAICAVFFAEQDHDVAEEQTAYSSVQSSDAAMPMRLKDTSIDEEGDVIWLDNSGDDVEMTAL